MKQKAIIELHHAQPTRRGNNQIRARTRPELKVSAHKQAIDLIEQGRLTLRDLDLARACIGVGILTRHQIQRLFFNDQMKTASNRLTKLYYNYYFLDRGPYWLTEMGEMGLVPCYLYALGRVGLAAFALHSGHSRHEMPLTPGRYSLMRSNHLLLHDVQISELFTQLHLWGHEAGLRVRWHNESAAALYRGEEELVRPDGAALLYRQDGTYHSGYFVELDRGHTPWAQKVAFYERARQARQSWQEILDVSIYPTVLCVVPVRLRDKVIAQIATYQPQTCFYVKTWEQVLATGMYAEWYEPVQGRLIALDAAGQGG